MQVAPVIPVDSTVISIILATGISIIGRIWGRAKEEGRLSERESAARVESERQQAEMARMETETHVELQALSTAVRDFRESLATVKGVLVGVDGQNGMRADMKEVRAELRSQREKIGALDMAIQTAAPRRVAK